MAAEAGWRAQVYQVIFEADTPAGKLFDVVLLWSILLSIALVLLDSVAVVHNAFGGWLYGAEWVFTALFTVEYALRLLSAPRPLRYARSFFGVVDLLAIVPTYLSLFIAGSQTLLVVRALRMLRVFRVLKLSRYLREAMVLRQALRASLPKIGVFLYTVLTLVIIFGALMYLIEGPERGFTSIPTSIYWAIVTLTTVGYGDIAPASVPGRLLASLVMIMGYGIIAVPTGIVTVEMSRVRDADSITTRVCGHCMREGHDKDARHCKFCGADLPPRVAATD
ncbi:ion transporter [Immundisolibacter sp.]|uniref:ion transporter n=1 Tax=Immundisolibacter sp. TaxID=1934948 RepID=UPI000ECEFC37|nr:ion transporter [Gammaproteobacteria bacterium]